MLTFTPWDIALVAAVSIQATILAYLHRPRSKAFMLSLPIPFTFATLAVARPVDATNAAGLLVLLLFTHGVRLLHRRLGLPIVIAIVLSALGYCVAGTSLAAVLPPGDPAFWSVCAITAAIGGVLYWRTPHRDEPGHRSTLPVYIKLPIIAVVIVFLVLIKKHLHGFMTLFPMVGVIAAYEARHSLWTVCRQIPVVMLTLLPMIVTIRLVQPVRGLGPALVLGWLVFLLVLLPLTWRQWKSDDLTL
jgi:hypothetical protein